MAKRYFFLLLLSCSLRFSAAQILCIKCYEQNDSISSGVTNLLLNGGFENTTCTPSSGVIGAPFSFCPNSSGYSCDFANWTCTGGGSDTYCCLYDNNYSLIVEGTNAVYFGNHFCQACSAIPDDTSCLNNAGCTVASLPAGYPSNDATYGGTAGVSLQQTVNGLIPGNTYVLEFWAGGEGSNLNTPNSGLFAVDVGFGDTLLRNKPTPFPGGIGTRYLVEFNATSSSQTIRFTNWGHICSTCTELVLDNVRLYTAKELSPSVPPCGVTTEVNEPRDNAAVVLFPNPATDELTVTINNNRLSEIILYDAVSGKILSRQFTNTVSLNTEPLARGIYLYEVRNEDGVIKQGKMVKE